ncbi:CHASE4 domain-containing protein [Vibrio sp. LaRot3]|uniref:CHASE4 domain-containing protein n=1 Tax=Vibrio sp. LaRot3 TaxID=2998829 RepID=UPI0022CE2EC3|nr:CHASE4 domain-containing protein [Vibrio sp. LaRot3]MDA0150252.1 PAS domain-containing protein [Vibrio sp. LaRot3]
MQGSIERRLLLLFIVAMIITLSLVSVFSLMVARSEGLRDEKEYNLEQAALGISLVKFQVSHLATLAKDYSQWDSTYQFVQSPTDLYKEQHLDLDSLIVTGIHGAMIQRSDDEILYGVSQLANNENAQLWEMFSSVPDYGLERFETGVLYFNSKLYLYVSSPITDNSGDLKANGRLVMLKALNASLTSEISHILRREFTMHSSATDNSVFVLTGQDKWQLKAASTTQQGNELIGYYQIVHDKEGILPIDVSVKTHYENDGVLELIYEWLPSLVALMVLPLVMTFLLRKHITRPIKELINWLNQVDGSMLAEELKPFKHADNGEIGHLSEKFSSIYNNLYQEHQFSQLLLYSISDFIFTVDHQGKIDYCNPAATEWLNVSANILYGQSFELLFDNLSEDTPCPSNWLYRAIECGSEYSGISLIRKFSSRDKSEWLEIQVSPMIRSEEEQAGAMIILRAKPDYTEA